MKEKLLKEFIEVNQEFFSSNPKRVVGGKKILIDATCNDEFPLIVTMKVSAAVSQVLGREMLVLPALRADATQLSIIRSFMPCAILKPVKLMVVPFLRHLLRLVKVFFTVKQGSELAALTETGMPVGIRIYDSLLRRFGLATIEKISLYHKIFVIIEMTFFFAMLRLFEKEDISFVILQDNAYRHGLIYEIIKSKNIPCLAGIDMYGLSMHKYETAEDYQFHCRTPEIELIDRLMSSNEVSSEVESYISFRFSGEEKQHDLMRAYSEHKVAVNREGLIWKYHLDPSKKIVLVMAHIFCDAPHGYPGMLFRDYQEWLVETCKYLSGNRNVNFLVKEHPSASLYHEEGLIDDILGKHGFHKCLLSKDINTRSLFNSIDAMVTCGGTAGMEFPCFGVPVIVAARPPYVDFDYIKGCSSLEEYHQALSSIHLIEPLGDEFIHRAKVVLYTIQSLMRVPMGGLGLGTQQNYLGCVYDFEKFLQELIRDCREPSGYSNLVRAVARLLQGPYKNLIDYARLPLSVAA